MTFGIELPLFPFTEKSGRCYCRKEVKNMSNWYDEPDRYWHNNCTDGEVFAGYDSEDGYTDWYDKDGNLDSRTETPSEWEQDMNDAGY